MPAKPRKVICAQCSPDLVLRRSTKKVESAKSHYGIAHLFTWNSCASGAVSCESQACQTTRADLAQGGRGPYGVAGYIRLSRIKVVLLRWVTAITVEEAGRVHEAPARGSVARWMPLPGSADLLLKPTSVHAFVGRIKSKFACYAQRLSIHIVACYARGSSYEYREA